MARQVVEEVERERVGAIELVEEERKRPHRRFRSETPQRPFLQARLHRPVEARRQHAGRKRAPRARIGRGSEHVGERSIGLVGRKPRACREAPHSLALRVRHHLEKEPPLPHTLLADDEAEADPRRLARQIVHHPLQAAEHPGAPHEPLRTLEMTQEF
ncbi:MAG: hypothetical protein U0166_22230 [Acidobacteriota bacterium]